MINYELLQQFSHQSIRQKEKPVMYCIATRVLVSAGECVASCAVC